MWLRDGESGRYGVSAMRKIAGLLVATTHLGFASHALAEGAAKSNHSTKRAAAVVAAAAPQSVFAHADRDRDGTVSFSEFATVVHESLARRIAKRFRQLDRNHDGRCTRGEVNRMSLSRFSRLDLDRDGYFTVSELTLVMKREIVVHLEHAYTRLDVDRDGRFSVAELTPVRVPSLPGVAASKPRKVASGGAGSVH
jgi:Ca2+-binding EF-hand superfamily protein